jgi:hypothetical protein
MSTTNATLSTFAQSLATIANNLAASANAINMGTVGIVQSANDLAKLATEISVASVEKVEEKKPEIVKATNDIQMEFKNEANFQPRAFQLIDCKTMEKAFYYLQNGISRKEIAVKFNLDITLAFEHHFRNKQNFGARLSTSQIERMHFYVAFFAMSTVASFFTTTNGGVMYSLKNSKYFSYRNTRLGAVSYLANCHHLTLSV